VKTHWACFARVGMLFLLTGTIFMGVLPARAFEPMMNYLYIETLVVSDVDLPPGVALRVSDPAIEARAFLTLENQNKTLLYVLSLNYKDALVMVTPDPDWKNRVNLAHEVASYLVAPSRPACLGMEALIDLDLNLVDHNELIFSPPTEDTAIPAPQSSELLLVYSEQVLLVPFTLTYTLNTHYDDGSLAYEQWMAYTQATDDARVAATQQAKAAAAQAQSNNMIVIGLASVAVLLIGGWLVWRLFFRSR
jgi:hypothetical protein